MKEIKSSVFKGFTLIELLIVVAIIGILASVILISMAENGRKARVASVVSSMRSALPVILSCSEEGGIIIPPLAAGGNAICFSKPEVWPALQWNWTYELVGPPAPDFSADCVFRVNPNNGGPLVTCSCKEQSCR